MIRRLTATSNIVEEGKLLEVEVVGDDGISAVHLFGYEDLEFHYLSIKDAKIQGVWDSGAIQVELNPQVIGERAR